MGLMFRALFASIASFFTAFEKVGVTMVNLTTITEEMSATYLDTTRQDRENNRVKQAAKAKEIAAKAQQRVIEAEASVLQ